MLRLLASSRRLILAWCLLAMLATLMVSIKTTLRENETHEAQARSKVEQGVVCTCNTSTSRDRHEQTTSATDPHCTTYSRFELNRRYQVNVSTIDMQSVEEIVFGDARVSAETYIEEVSAALMTSGSEKLTPYYKNHTSFMEVDSKNILLGNYTYFAGGRWRPINCVPKWKVAIVIPYRDRIEHLAILIRNLLQALTLQNLEFGIFVAEQANDLVFNRGLMKNIGYMESTNFGAWDCAIFHDIDQVPMRATNSYGCENMPKHMCAYAEEMGFKLMYGALFGGVVGVSAEQMKKSNGYSNVYWGWGGEDDDIRSRLNKMEYKIHRASGEGYYKTLKHKKKTAGEICTERHCLLKHYAERMAWDGISNTHYNANVTLNLLFTHIAVDVRKEEWNTYKCKK